MRRKVSAPSRASHEASFRLPMMPSPRRHRVTKLPLAVSVSAFLSVIAVVIGALAASSMQRDDMMLRAELNRSSQGLLSRIEQLEQRLCGTPVVPTPVSNALPVTVSAQDLIALRPNVNVQTWNAGAATETVEYRDKERGISMRLPYNPKWGNEIYKVAPFEVLGDTLLFGPVAIRQDDGSFYRKFSVKILPSFKNLSTDPDIMTRSKRLGTYDVSIATITDGRGELRFEGKKYTYILTEVLDNKDPNMNYQTVPMNDAAALSLLRTLRAI